MRKFLNTCMMSTLLLWPVATGDGTWKATDSSPGITTSPNKGGVACFQLVGQTEWVCTNEV